MSQTPGAASRLAAARLERAQLRADAARKTPSTTNASAYGFWPGAPAAGASPAASPGGAADKPGVMRTKSAECVGAPASEAQGAAGANGQPTMAEIGVPIVMPGSSGAFAVCSKEGALHENHDRGAAVILPNQTVLFACLDGHGAEGASVSGYALRNLLSGAAAALEAGKSAADAPIALTKDHKPTDPKERQRLAQVRAIVRPSRVINPHTGAWIEVGAVRVWDASQIYGVAMSRSLGDMQVHPFLIPTPDIASALITEHDKFLVLATDGVWDVMENDEAVGVAMKTSPDASCKEIVDVCARRWDTQMPGRRDDITTVVVDLTHSDMSPKVFKSAWADGS